MATQNQELAITQKPFKPAGHDIEQGWHQVFFKILHDPKGLDSLTKSEHAQFNKFINERFNQTLWKGKRIVAVGGKQVPEIRKTIKDDLRSQIILYLKGGTDKRHISEKQLLKLTPEQLFKKIDTHAHNYLYYWYVKRPVREAELREEGKMLVGDSGQIRPAKREEVDSRMRIRLREPTQEEVTLAQARGDVENDELDSIQNEAFSKVAEEHKDELKKKKIPKWAREALEASIRHRTVKRISEDHGISLEAAEIKREMDISAQNKKRLIKRKR